MFENHLMAVDSVKCALTTSATTRNSTENYLVLDCGVMTNVCCSPPSSLAHSAQTQSSTRSQSLLPSLNTTNLNTTSAELNIINSTISSVLNTNSSAMQHLIEKTNLSSPSSSSNNNNLVNKNDDNQMETTNSSVQSPKTTSSQSTDQNQQIQQKSNLKETTKMNHNSQDEDDEMDADRPIDNEQKIKKENDVDDDLVSSDTVAAASPNHNIHHNLSNSNHSPISQSIRETDRKEVSFF